MVKWWDIRKLRRPIEEIVMDLEDPERADPFKAIGITALQYDPIMGSRFLVGLENGVVINANRKSPNITQKLAMRFRCSFGPIINIERNPFICKHFLTVSNWNLKIWADDIKEDCLICVWLDSRNFIIKRIKSYSFL
jgi:dynein intermediate chain 2